MRFIPLLTFVLLSPIASVWAAIDCESGDRRDYPYMGYETHDQVFTLSGWIYPETISGNIPFFIGMTSGDASAAAPYLTLIDTNTIRHTTPNQGGAWTNRTADNNSLTTNVWQRFAVARTGTDRTDPLQLDIYVGATETGYQSTNTGTGTSRIPAGTERVCGEATVDTRLSDLAVWSREILAGEHAALADGFSPRFFLHNLIFLVEESFGAGYDVMSGGTVTETGSPTTAGAPPIIYPESPAFIFAGTAATATVLPYLRAIMLGTGI